MGDMLIRNIPEAWKADIDTLAKRGDRSRTDLAREALRVGLDEIARKQSGEDNTPPGDRLRAIFKGIFDTNEEADEFQRDLDEVRRGDYGRPFPVE